MAAGIRSQPRAAQRVWEQAYYARNREKLLGKSQDWQRANPETVLKMRRAYTPQRAATQRMVRYGLTEDRYQAMVTAQDGKCAICQRVMTPPHVDHDHNTGQLRGLLCDNCNRGIGHLKESPQIMNAAITYLRKGVN